jgi:hypothetical protein
MVYSRGLPPYPLTTPQAHANMKTLTADQEEDTSDAT